MLEIAWTKGRFTWVVPIELSRCDTIIINTHLLLFVGHLLRRVLFDMEVALANFIARVFKNGYACSITIFLHSSAQERHSSAQRLQCSALCFSHSSAQASHISAQALQSNKAYSPPIDISSAADRQTEAHCLLSSIQRIIIFTPSSRKHSVAQCSHSIAHATHASIQLCIRS